MGNITQVNRGDLITADFVNQLIGALNGLDTRVTALEGSGATGPNQVVITALEPPSGTVRVGDVLTIRGQNFGQSSGRLRVFIDDLAITDFSAPGTNDQTIIITIPAGVGSPPLAGRAAQLTVSNSITQAFRTITLMPTATLTGTVPVSLVGTDPVPTAGANFTMQMHLQSQLSRVAMVQIGVQVSGISATPVLLTTGLTPMDAQVQMNPNDPLDFAVRIPIPAAAGTSNFTVTVTASAEGTQFGIQASPLTVGTPVVQPDPTIAVAMPTTASVAPAGAGSYTSGVLHLTAPGATGNFSFAVTLKATGVHTVTVSPPSGTGWTVTNLDGALTPFTIANSDLTTGSALKVFHMKVAVAAGATNGSFSFSVTRVGGTANGTSQIINLAST